MNNRILIDRAITEYNLLEIRIEQNRATPKEMAEYERIGNILYKHGLINEPPYDIRDDLSGYNTEEEGSGLKNYNKFFKHHYHLIKNKYPQYHNTQIVKKIGELWRKSK